ncbi:glycine oxidase ThiO [Candidatus Magnetaquicoccus inordinatus]|uniref:glycine oxidase ThiO n=1 Tax=Candidatus Magnetaquicoccus inordinatus TaxID=2496818 RepID=UPI00102C7707|nr:glycine oxidase ThiO [Candidatus Magnetaquicoccus inordinatus]
MGSDVLIVGAGVMGCACAYRLLQAGLQVTVLEKALPGVESSAAAAGILGAQSEVAGAGPFFELCLASRELFADFVQELQELTDIAIGYERSGVLEVALDANEGHLAAGRVEWMLERGLRVEILNREEALRLEPALQPTLIGANYYPDDHQLDPDRLMRALTAAVVRLGGQFLSGVQALSLASAEGRVLGIHSERGLLSAAAVVIAGGAWSSRLPGIPRLRTSVQPVAGQIVQLESRPAFFRHVVYGFKGYIVPRSDGRVLLGSTLEDRGFDKAVTCEGLHRITGMAMAMVPALQQARLERTWSGLRPATGDNLPLLGAGPLPGLYFATGHYRNGILLTPISAEVICAQITGQIPPVDIAPFSP